MDLARVVPSAVRERGLAPLCWRVAGVVLAVAVMWPDTPLTPEPGLDLGWVTALHLARLHGARFGRDVVFNLGPLGFVLVPTLSTTWQLLYSTVLLGCLCAAVVLGTYHVARHRSASPGIAMAVTAGVVLVIPKTGLYLCDVLAVVFVVVLVDHIARRRVLASGWAAAAGAGAAVLLLCKVSTGLVAGAALLIGCVPGALPRRRVVSAVLGATGSVLVLWLGLGQRIQDLWAWFSGIREETGGHNWSMGIEEPGRRWELVALALTTIVVAVAGIGRWRRWTRGPVDLRRPRREAVALAGLVALGWWYVVKQGFVRHDSHAWLWWFAVIFGVATLSDWSNVAQRARQAGLVVAALIGMVLSLRVPLIQTFEPTPSVSTFVNVVDAVVDPGHREATIEAARQSLRDRYKVPAVMLDDLARRSVAIVPYDAGPAWAYGLDWRPLPTLTRYLAYTPRLDDLDRQALVGPQRPDRVLRSVDATVAIDHRYPLLEAPATQLSLLCDFVARSQDTSWQDLEPVVHRCSASRQLMSTTVAPGQQVPVPEYDPGRQALLVAIDVHSGILDDLLAAVYKAPEWHLTVDGTDYRIVPLTSSTPGLLYVPPSSGWSPTFRLFTSAPRSLAVDAEATVTFSVVDVAPA